MQYSRCVRPVTPVSSAPLPELGLGTSGVAIFALLVNGVVQVGVPVRETGLRGPGPPRLRRGRRGCTRCGGGRRGPRAPLPAPSGNCTFKGSDHTCGERPAWRPASCEDARFRVRGRLLARESRGHARHRAGRLATVDQLPLRGSFSRVVPQYMNAAPWRRTPPRRVNQGTRSFARAGELRSCLAFRRGGSAEAGYNLLRIPQTLFGR